MIISLIAALSENRVIGVNNQLPWHIPADLKRFRKITSGHPVVMGRKTFESVGQPLPNRHNVVITRQKDYQKEGITVVGSVEEALKLFENKEDEVFILGGGEIFNQTLPMANRLYLTWIHKNYEGDAYFPQPDLSEYDVTFEEKLTDPVPFSFVNYERKKKAT